MTINPSLTNLPVFNVDGMKVYLLSLFSPFGPGYLPGVYKVKIFNPVQPSPPLLHGLFYFTEDPYGTYGSIYHYKPINDQYYEHVRSDKTVYPRPYYKVRFVNSCGVPKLSLQLIYPYYIDGLSVSPFYRYVYPPPNNPMVSVLDFTDAIDVPYLASMSANVFNGDAQVLALANMLSNETIYVDECDTFNYYTNI